MEEIAPIHPGGDPIQLVARVWRADKSSPVGVAFLLDSAHLMTCAHVVCDALSESGCSDEREVPDKALVWVDFPVAVLREVKLFPAYVEGRFWRGKDGPPPRDVAVLALREGTVLPTGLASVRGCEHSEYDDELMAYGVKAGLPEGTFVRGKIAGRLRSDRVEVFCEHVDQAIRPGCSGAAAWNVTRGGVAGMIVEMHTSSQGRMIPIDMLLDAWRPSATVAPAGEPQREGYQTDEYFLRRIEDWDLSSAEDVCRRNRRYLPDIFVSRSDSSQRATAVGIVLDEDRRATAAVLGLIAASPYDARENLLSIFAELKPVHNAPPRDRKPAARWCDGARCLEAFRHGETQEFWSVLAAGAVADPSDARAVSTAASALRTALGTIVLLDFSSLSVTVILEDPAELQSLASFLRKMAAIGTRFQQDGNRMVLGLPRHVMHAANVRTALELACATHLFETADPDSARELHRHRAVDPQIVDEPSSRRMLDLLLAPLRNFNSNALRHYVDEFLEDAENGALSDSLQLLDLADRLHARGFLEAAYRLELASSTRPQLESAMPLAVNLESAGASAAKLFQQLADARYLPVTHSRIVLVGPAGSGKTTALAMIESAYAIAQESVRTRRTPRWLPIRITRQGIASARAGDFFSRRPAHTGTTGGSGPRVLQAHQLLARVESPEILHWLFRSPLLFLMDDGELLFASPNRAKLAALMTPAFVMALSSAEDLSGSEDSALETLQEDHIVASLTGIQPSQAKLVLEASAGPRAKVLFDRVDSPLRRMTGNAFLLMEISKLRWDVDRLGKAQSLFEVVTEAVGARTGMGGAGDELAEMLCGLAAHRRLDAARPALKESLLRKARANGLVTGDDPVFRHEYFELLYLARYLRDFVPQGALQDSLAHFFRGPRDGWSKRHANLVRMLCGALPIQAVDGFARFLCSQDQHELAHVGLLELGAEEYRTLPELRHVVDELIEHCAFSDLGKARIAADSLSYRDPRIPATPPLEAAWREYSESGRMALHTVTNLEYGRFMLDGGYESREFWSRSGWRWKTRNRITTPAMWDIEDFCKPNYPVVGVSFHEANAYCKWLSAKLGPDGDGELSLPTSGEWDRAAGLQGLARQILQEPSRTQQFLKESESAIDAPSGLSISGPQPFEAAPSRGFGVSGLFNGIWEWCRDSIDGADVPEVLESGDQSLALTAVVRGGPNAAPGELWPVLGNNGLDVGARMHLVGFRVHARKGSNQ